MSYNEMRELEKANARKKMLLAEVAFYYDSKITIPRQLINEIKKELQ